MHRGFVGLQSQYRRMHTKQRYSLIVGSVTKLQGAWRGYSARMARLHNTKENVCRETASLLIQKVVRRHLASRQVSETRQSLLHSNNASKIQTKFRQYLSRKRFLLTISGIISLQSQVRKRGERRKLILALQASVVLQSSWRKYSAQVMSRNFSIRHDAAILLQSVARRHRVLRRRAILEKQKAAAVRIQSIERARQVRAVYLFILEMAIVLQSAIRMRNAMRERRKLSLQKLRERDESATRIQSLVRMRQIRVVYVFLVGEVITLQSAIRMHLALKHKFVILRSIGKLQTVVRIFLARRRMESAFNRNLTLKNDIHKYLTEKEHEKVARAADNEVMLLLSGDRAALQNAGVCLRRLVEHVTQIRFLRQAGENELGKAREILLNVQEHCAVHNYGRGQ
jgi:hypothetical protein